MELRSPETTRAGCCRAHAHSPVQVRRTQRATWFPLLVLAAVTFAAIPFRYSPHRLGTCTAAGDLPRVCTAYPPALLVYWPTALVLAYVVIAAFYIRRSQARGVGTRVRPYVVAGIILALAMTGSLVWTLYHPLAFPLAGPGLFSGAAQLPLRYRRGPGGSVVGRTQRGTAGIGARLLGGRAGDRHRRLGQRPQGAAASPASS